MSGHPWILWGFELGVFKASFVILWTSFVMAFCSSSQCVSVRLAICLSVILFESVSLSVYPSSFFSSLSCICPITHFTSPPLASQEKWFLRHFSLISINLSVINIQKNKVIRHPALPLLVCWLNRSPTNKIRTFCNSILSDTRRGHLLLKCEFWNCLDSWWGPPLSIISEKIAVRICGDIPLPSPFALIELHRRNCSRIKWMATAAPW